MEKINALIDKLQELKNEQAGLHSLSYYTQLLYAEITYALSEPHQVAARPKVAVIPPGGVPRHNAAAGAAYPAGNNAVPEPPQAVSPAVPEPPPAVSPAAPEKEPAPAVPPKAEPHAPSPAFPAAEANGSSAAARFSRPPAANRELNDAIAQEGKQSLNDLLKEEKTELARKLGETGVTDLHAAIGINDKFQFINELFRGDRDMYERSIKTINDFSTHQQATYWMERELKTRLGWQDTHEPVQQFYAVVKKRFS